jgi:hypothetical protein
MSAKPASDFASNKSRPNGLSFYCRECSTAYQVAWLGTPKGVEAAARTKARRDAAAAEKRASRAAAREAAAEKRKQDRAARQSPDIMARPTHVYVLTAREFVKIGVASDVERRRRSVQGGCPHPIEVAYVTEPMHRIAAFALENALHTRFADSTALVSGDNEWFTAPVDEIVNEVKRREIFGTWS